MRSSLQCIVVTILVCSIFAHDSFAQSSVSTGSADVRAQLYFFTNAACGPCRQVEPEIVKLYSLGYPVVKVDTVVQPQWAQRFQVNKTPTVILVKGGQVVGRHSGMIDCRSLQAWFDAIRYRPRQTAAASSANQRPRPATASPTRSVSVELPPDLPKTVHRGTDVAANPAEREALIATVRLRVEDPEGISYATGTVIHSYNGESLVLTCGHVFRDAKGKGKITAVYDFATGNAKNAPGELIYYDADARDIALVAIKPGEYIKPATIAPDGFLVQRGDQIFSIGCDHGEPPTIRQSRIKNQAKYNGVKKYDIFGRPVVGRSGGGLFTPGGQLIGVCNAAVVDEDEGVYVGLDTVYWQIAKVNLTHLFTGDQAIAANFDEKQGTRLPAEASVPGRQFASRDMPSAAEIRANPRDGSSVNSQWQTLATHGGMQRVKNRTVSAPLQKDNARAISGPADTELIVILRTNDQPQPRTWTIRNPGADLLRQLSDANRPEDPPASGKRLASLRRHMPEVPSSRSDGSQMRAQSPR